MSVHNVVAVHPIAGRIFQSGQKLWTLATVPLARLKLQLEQTQLPQLPSAVSLKSEYADCANDVI